MQGISDWSPDGNTFLISRLTDPSAHVEIWQIPSSAELEGRFPPRRVASSLDRDLWQARFSPDGRWILFQANTIRPEIVQSTFYAVPTAGGPWVRITDGQHWDDKPRWSRDGETVLYLSGRKGFFNVWGVRFDPAKGRVIGVPFQITSFETPEMIVPRHIPSIEFSVGNHSLVLPIARASGSTLFLDKLVR